MENFFYNHELFGELSEILHYFDLEEEDVHNLPDDWKIECNESSLEPVMQLSADMLIEYVESDRLPEDDDVVLDQIYTILKGIDFEKANSEMPKLYYATSNKIIITKRDLLDYIEPPKHTPHLTN